MILLTGMTGAHHCTQLLVEMGACEFPTWDWPRTKVLLISASQVVKIIDMSHQHQATEKF
jgi:hypothetical protein